MADSAFLSKPNEMDRSFLDANVDDVVSKLTIDEKIDLLSGRNFWE